MSVETCDCELCASAAVLRTLRACLVGTHGLGEPIANEPHWRREVRALVAKLEGEQ